MNKKQAFTERLAQNSIHYSPKVLFNTKASGEFLEWMRASLGLETLMTDRHGSIIDVHGDFGDFKPDVKNKPGNKIRVQGRTVAHIYTKYDHVAETDKPKVESLLSIFMRTLEGYSEKSYLSSEQSIYIEELEKDLKRERSESGTDRELDPLTGVYNRNAFIGRMKTLKQREIVPTAVIIANINDWKFVDDNFGEEESDRLIVTIADILQDCAQDRKGCEYAIIGRNEGDVFHILLPQAEEHEARDYCEAVKKACEEYEDGILAPSVAIGCVMKTNVEESFKALFSDAEYEMFDDKFAIKARPGYRERLEKGLKKD